MQNDPKNPNEKEKDKNPAESNWAADQKERCYYYDDAHGYQQFDPELEEEADDERESEGCEPDD